MAIHVRGAAQAATGSLDQVARGSLGDGASVVNLCNGAITNMRPIHATEGVNNAWNWLGYDGPKSIMVATFEFEYHRRLATVPNPHPDAKRMAMGRIRLCYASTWASRRGMWSQVSISPNMCVLKCFESNYTGRLQLLPSMYVNARRHVEMPGCFVHQPSPRGRVATPQHVCCLGAMQLSWPGWSTKEEDRWSGGRFEWDLSWGSSRCSQGMSPLMPSQAKSNAKHGRNSFPTQVPISPNMFVLNQITQAGRNFSPQCT